MYILISTLCFRKIKISPKWVIPSGFFMEFEKFATAYRPTVGERNINGLLLIAPYDDGERGQVLSIRSLPVDHTRHSALCTARWLTVRDAASRGFISVADICIKMACHYWSHIVKTFLNGVNLHMYAFVRIHTQNSKSRVRENKQRGVATDE